MPDHYDAASWWSGPRRRHIVVVRRGCLGGAKARRGPGQMLRATGMPSRDLCQFVSLQTVVIPGVAEQICPGAEPYGQSRSLVIEIGEAWYANAPTT